MATPLKASGDVVDLRSAIAMSTTLSTQLISATATMLTIVSAAWIFIAGNKSVDGYCPLWVIVTAVLFIISIIMGGRGITAARNAGFEGKWDVTAGQRCFNGQALFCFAGILSFILSLAWIAGKPPSAEAHAEVESLRAQLAALESRVLMIEKDRRLDDWSLRVNKVETDLQILEKLDPSQRIDNLYLRLEVMELRIETLSQNHRSSQDPKAIRPAFP